MKYLMFWNRTIRKKMKKSCPPKDPEAEKSFTFRRKYLLLPSLDNQPAVLLRGALSSPKDHCLRPCSLHHLQLLTRLRPAAFANQPQLRFCRKDRMRKPTERKVSMFSTSWLSATPEEAKQEKSWRQIRVGDGRTHVLQSWEINGVRSFKQNILCSRVFVF